MSSSSATCRCCCSSTSSSTACRRVGGFATTPTTSFIATLSLYAGAYLVEVFRAGLEAVPRGLIDAGKAIGLTPLQRLVHVRLPTMFRDRAAVLEQHLRLAVQGHLGRLGHRRAGADLRRAVDQHQHLPHRRGLCRGRRRCISSPATRSSSLLRLLERRYAIAALSAWSSSSSRCRSSIEGLLVTLQVSALVVVLSLVARRRSSASASTYGPLAAAAGRSAPTATSSAASRSWS